MMFPPVDASQFIAFSILSSPCSATEEKILFY